MSYFVGRFERAPRSDDTGCSVNVTLSVLYMDIFLSPQHKSENVQIQGMAAEAGF